MLVLKPAVAEPAQPVERDGVREAVARFALVELGGGELAERRVLENQRNVNRVRSIRPTSRSAAARLFCCR